MAVTVSVISCIPGCCSNTGNYLLSFVKPGCSYFFKRQIIQRSLL